MKWENSLTQLLNTRYPFIQAPMLGITTPAMVASISNAGCLGSLPIGAVSPAVAQEMIALVKKQTACTFLVNLFVFDYPQTPKEPALETLRSYYTRYGLPFPANAIDNAQQSTFGQLIDVIIQENIRVVSFTFGIPGKSTIDLLKSHGVILIGNATCVEEARMIENAGLDLIVAQGIEAGGHRASFVEGPIPPGGIDVFIAPNY